MADYATVYLTSVGWMQGEDRAVRDALERQGHLILSTLVEPSPASITDLYEGVDAYVVVVGAPDDQGAIGDERDLASVRLEIAEADRLGLPVFVFVEEPYLDSGPLPELHPRQVFFGSLDEVRALAAEAGAVIVPRDRGRRRSLHAHPPVERPGADDAGLIGSEIEGLLGWVERYVADESNPDDLLREVEVRQSQLIHELELIGQGKGRSAVLTGIVSALLPLVRPAPADDPLGAAADEVADAAIALGEASSDEEIVAAGQGVVAALGHVGDEMAAYGVDDLKTTVLRTAGAWFEEDARPHLNAFITAARERALPAGGGAAGGVVTSWMGGPPWLVVTVVALGLLRARFPWIFRRSDDDPS